MKQLMGQKKKERQSVDKLFSSAMSMLVPSHILEYFEMWDARESRDRWVIGLTNAKAENLNGKLQRFLSANYGLKDKDFFLYRTVGYFS
jgi:hypothetical protein